MKKIVGLWVLSVMIGCSYQKKKESACTDSTLYGYVSICLPEIGGMTECRAHASVQAVIQPYLASGPVLGYYLNNETYKQVDKLNEITYEDYFMIYGDYQRENYAAQEADLDLAEKALEETLFDGTHFDRISSRVEADYGTITAGQPALLEKYSRHRNVRTMIVLMKYKNGENETSVVSAVDFVLVKNRLFNLAYYVAYSGGKSIDDAKIKNDAFVEKLLQLN
ncbi:MAG: hypothetical protein LBT83_06340 [Tannerella sp.]|jgi:hypothetical protein|nr:hypothetical protein [Tannerella sp.]